MNTNKWNTHKSYADSENLTELLDVIPFEIFSDSLNEINLKKECFNPHSYNSVYLESGPLRECKSVFLTNKNILPFTYDLFSFLKNKINSELPSSKAYVTVLKPGGKIYEHCDAGSLYWDNIKRYQFYLTGNSSIIQLIKNKQFETKPGYFYFFDHKQLHYYENNSTDDLILMVFDIQGK